MANGIRPTKSPAAFASFRCNRVNPAVREELKAVLAAADAAVAEARPRCDASGRCCRFREYGHTLFISQIEADHLLEEPPPAGGPYTDAGCPYQVENLCTARERRPLGCRLYFCDPAYQDTAPRLSERFIRELKQLCDRQSLPWRYAPLHVFLAEHTAPRPAFGRSSSERLSLPITALEP